MQRIGVQEAEGANYASLVALKHEYDPTNVFDCNMNIDPVGS